jgi:hypothetical protein
VGSEVKIGGGVLDSILGVLNFILFFETSLKLFDDERSLFLLLQKIGTSSAISVNFPAISSLFILPSLL